MAHAGDRTIRYFDDGSPSRRLVDRILQRETYARLWRGWLIVAKAIARLQTRLVMAFIYFTCLAPFALVVRVRLRRDYLQDKPVWHPPTAGQGSGAPLDSARQQF